MQSINIPDIFFTLLVSNFDKSNISIESQDLNI